MRCVGYCLAVALLVPTGAAAARKTPDQAPVVKALLGCRATSPDAERLACFDAAARKLGDAVDANDVVVVDREQVKTARRQIFGLSIPNFNIFKSDGKDEIEELEGVVSAARVDGNGRWQVTLAEGATWQQTDDKPLVKRPKPGSKVLIKTASFGSYFMRIDGQPGVRARRER